jgi:hypothetical protein
MTLASEAALRAATVTLGDVPCDLLAWEHMTWECATLDTEARFSVGFALPEGVTVDRRPVPMLLVPSGREGVARNVRWADLAATERLVLRVAVPDGASAGARVRVAIDDRVVDVFQTDEASRHERERVIATGVAAGRRVALTVEVRAPPGDSNRATVALDGEFR